MSRRLDIPGLQYPDWLDESEPEHAAIRNIYDNLFYIRSQVSNPVIAATATGQIQQIIRDFNLNTGPTTTVVGTSILVGSHATRITVYGSPTLAVGTEYYEYDRSATYIISDSTGVNTWVLAASSMVALIASRPTDLAAVDAGFFFTDSTTDNETEYAWTGTEWVTIGGYLQEIADAILNTVTTVAKLRHSTSGLAAQGYGLAVVSELEDSGGVNQTAAYDTVEWSNAGTTSSLRRWYLRVAGVVTDLLDLASSGNLTAVGSYIMKAATAFTGTLTHGITGNRVWTFPDDTGNVVYETATLTNNNFTFGAGNAKLKDAGFAIVPVANGGTGIAYDRIADTIALTNQGADIVATNFAHVVAPGTYRVNYYLEDTSADVAAGAVQLTVAFTDDNAATTKTSAAVALTGIGTVRDSGVFYVQLASGNVTYAVAHTGVFGTAKYALYICFERLS